MPDKSRSNIMDRLESLRQTAYDLSKTIGVKSPTILLSTDKKLRPFSLCPSLESIAQEYGLWFDHPPSSHASMTMDIRFLAGLESLAFPSNVRPALQFTTAEERAAIAHELGHLLPDANSVYVPPASQTSDNTAIRTDAILHNHISEFKADRAILMAGESADAFISSILKIVRHNREPLYDRARRSGPNNAKADLVERRLHKENLIDGLDTPPSLYDRANLLHIPLKQETRWQDKLAQQAQTAREIELRTR